MRLSPRPAVVDYDIAALDITGVAQTFMECTHKMGERMGYRPGIAGCCAPAPQAAMPPRHRAA
jgi:hypothetical protein